MIPLPEQFLIKTKFVSIDLHKQHVMNSDIKAKDTKHLF